jgi:hypothetical protein
MSKQKHASFDVDRATSDLIFKCIARYETKYPKLDRTSLVMDLTATHANGCPMDFAKLLAAKDFDFYHDMFGIQAHIDRTSGKLKDCFLPRCSARRSA